MSILLTKVLGTSVSHLAVQLRASLTRHATPSHVAEWAERMLRPRACDDWSHVHPHLTFVASDVNLPSALNLKFGTSNPANLLTIGAVIPVAAHFVSSVEGSLNMIMSGEKDLMILLAVGLSHKLVNNS